MGDLDDLFGPTAMGPRPEHPDFAILVDLVLQQDGRTEDASFDMEEYLTSLGDNESISYIALQRAFRMVSLITGKNPLENPDLAVRLAALWVDAFCIGHNFAGRKGEDEVGRLLVEWIQGRMNGISEHSGDFDGDSAALRAEAQERAKQLGIAWTAAMDAATYFP